jgi:outer membrane biosynthesis protein TonB
MGLNDDYQYEEKGGSRKYGFLFGIGLVVLVLVGLVFGQVIGSKHAPTGRMPDVVMIKPLAPTPPPPPPPKVEPPKEMVQKMVEQTPLDHPEDKPEEPKDPQPALTTSLTGPGSDGFGLGHGNGGGGDGGRQSRGSKFGWYAGEVQRTIQEALSHNPIASHAQFVRKARIWADASGRVVRLKLAGTSADPTVDRAIEETINGLQLPEPPPSDMPMPIVMRLTARRPG